MTSWTKCKGIFEGQIFRREANLAAGSYPGKTKPILVLVPSIRLGSNDKYFIEMMTSENIPVKISICASLQYLGILKLWEK